MTESKRPERTPQPGTPGVLPVTIAIAGAWGYIGRRILNAAISLGVRPIVFDPGPLPKDVDPERITRIADQETFYRTPANLYHLALHPEHRQRALDILLERSQNPDRRDNGTSPAHKRILILNEKPMAPPEDPVECARLIARVNSSQAIMLFNFPELFHPMTLAIGNYLRQFRHVEIQSMTMQRSKDREADRPRNYKRMVPIQHQETVHCLAFMLWLLGEAKQSLDGALADGLRVVAQSQPYQPPNPHEYPYVVDGRCEYELHWGATQIRGVSDFKKNATWSKRRTIRGVGDGKPFVIEADYLEDRQYLSINGETPVNTAGLDSYQAVIQTFWNWTTHHSRKELLSGPFPNPEFTRLTYQLSSLLWRSSYLGQPIQIADRCALLAFDAEYAAAIRTFAKYE